MISLTHMGIFTDNPTAKRQAQCLAQSVLTEVYMFRPFADWLADTPLSKTLQDTAWAVPPSQSIHILAVSIVFGSACMVNLRLLGVGRSGRSISQLSNTVVPW